MNPLTLARRTWPVARGLRDLVRNPVTLPEAEATIRTEVIGRDDRFLLLVERLVHRYPASPSARLLDHAGIEPGDLRALVADRGLVAALETLRDNGVYVSYEEYHGREDARRGSRTFTFRPEDFFNPETPADYLATTGGSRSAGTPVELSFAWQRRQGVQRAVQLAMAGRAGSPGAVWLPVFPSAAGFGAVMKNAAGGNRPERWFSQVPSVMEGVAAHKQLANRFLPALNAMARTGLPRPEHVPSTDPAPVVAWMQDAVAREGRAVLTGYASSITAAARWALERGIVLTGVVVYPGSEPVTAGKLRTIRASGMRPFPQYAFVPEGTAALACEHCGDEDYHLWGQDMAVITRARSRGDHAVVPAFLWTSLALEAPRVLLNVENDDYGTLVQHQECDCELGRLGLTARLRDIRGISKVVAAGITLDGETFDELTETALPAAGGGGPGDYQFVEVDGEAGTTLTLRVHPRLGDVDGAALREAIRAVLARSDNGALARGVWGEDHLRLVRDTPVVTRAGKSLAFERIGTIDDSPPEAGRESSR
ncbi:MAG: hypothetical protein AB7O29_04695 [Acidimicrobiia bacterium]